MEISSFLTVSAGVLLRIGIPVALTVLLVSWFRRLDSHWSAQAERERTQLEAKGVVTARSLVKNAGCCLIKGCPPENRAKCRAYAHQDIPCWQVFRDENGHLQEKCLGCEVFTEAPVPLAA